MARTAFKGRDETGTFPPLMRLRALSLMAALVVIPAASARAADECAFFKGKTVELVVPFSAGGGFDAYGRMVAKYMGDALGAANMIVRNQPGAGGLLATNQTWTSEPDGLRIQLIAASGMIAAELGGAAGVAFQTRGFSWIGRVSGEPDVVTTGPDSAVGGIADIAKIGGERTVRIGSTGLGSPQYITARLLAKLLETKGDVITGFSGAPEVFASLGRGDLDLFASSLSAAEAAEKAQTARVLWVFGTERDPGRPELTPISDVVDARFLPLIKVQAAVVAAGRAIAAPPGIASTRLECLRDAFDRTVASAAFLDESRQLNRPVEPLSGERVAELIRAATEKAPREYLDLLHGAFAQ